jgi:hypothetical protein
MKRSAGTRPQRKAIRELGKRGIQGGNTLGEAKPAGEEAFYYFLRLVLVNFHRRLGVTRQNGTSSHHVVPPCRPTNVVPPLPIHHSGGKRNTPTRGREAGATERAAPSAGWSAPSAPADHIAAKSSAVTSAVWCALEREDKDHLLAEYNRGVQEWSQAVQRLSAQAGVDHINYIRILDRVNEVRARTQRARDAYVRHVDNHGC